MIPWLVAVLVAAGSAMLAYPPRQWGAGPGRRVTMLLALARAAAVGLVVALLTGAPRAPAAPPVPLVAVDVSASWRRAASDPAALLRQVAGLADSLVADATARAGTAAPVPEVVWVGDSLRPAEDGRGRLLLADHMSRVRPAVDLANATGRSLWLLTDGALDDPESLQEAPPGSRVITLPAVPRADLAVAELLVPEEALGGDTVVAEVELVAGGGGSPAGELHWLLDGAPVGATPTPALGPWAPARVTARLPLPRGERMAVVSAALGVAGDLEPRNDTLRAALAIGDRPPVVFVSTAPDLDVREALRVLRGTLRVPAEAYLRLAPGQWRVEGTLARLEESAVRARARSAAVLVLHGDTAWAGEVAGGAARAVWRPAPAATLLRAGEAAPPGEWFAAQPSPPGRGAPDAIAMQAALSTLPFDSLPPLLLPAVVDTARVRAPGTVLVEARLARRGPARPVVETVPRAQGRELRIEGSGFAGWAARGGRSADAFTALWGAVFDWLAAGRGDSRAAVPARSAFRAGEPIRWRRGGGDSVVAVRLTPRDGGGAEADTLAFGAEGREALGPARAPGIADVQLPGGRALLVVNPSREWVPRPPHPSVTFPAGEVRPSEAPRLVEAGWPFLLVLLLVSAEWIGRRFAGYR